MLMQVLIITWQDLQKYDNMLSKFTNAFWEKSEEGLEYTDIVREKNAAGNFPGLS